MDNLVFLRILNHTGDCRGHGKYDDLIIREINNLQAFLDAKKEQDAFSDLKEIISDYTDKIKEQLIGTKIKLDELQK
ncbi:hypothetical protein QNI19_05900 [Cytophagaceae bacterium DM2B3-1]|uniref:Uncharacterized protein n=1 Tax=Xanthocytophaga flava TaxID=3048013 RepID=A0ABT7CFD8_9BACT|nr:hypothetical protein [Xanthocytophaga flavus]MDJ1492454.1 hypothetical protein [Xanthocytophaga flavus]